MTRKLLYRLADLVLEVASPDLEKEWELSSRFRADYGWPDIKVSFIAQELKKSNNSAFRQIYSDRVNGIYTDGSELYKFREPEAGNDDQRQTWESCFHYNSNHPHRYQIYLKEKKTTEKDVFNAMCLDLIMAHHHRVILHSSYITYRGEGIVFTAPSGTGKSTQAGLWADTQDDVEIINGDRSILSCDGEIPEVHGLPFCGTSKICRNVSAPLCAAVVLRQGGENRIRRLGAAEAVKLLMSECAVSPWDREGTGNILDLLIRITERTPVYLLSCLPDDSAVRLLRQTLEEDRNRK